jgi:hypothetical protein
MKKLFSMVLLVLFLAAFTANGEQPEYSKKDPDKSRKGENILNDIESGRAYWVDFVNGIQSGQITFKKVSLSSVANYMEAFANEGMVELIPTQHFGNEEIQTALEVVFEDPSNIVKNQSGYEDHLKRLVNEEFFVCVESGTASWEVFVDVIESGLVKFKEVSPSAVANYMEAFANEGILESIPDQYFRNQEIQTALDAVFEDPANIVMNRNAYEAHLKQVLDVNYKCS